MANGNVTPDRIIEGQNTNLSRTMHGLAFDEMHDEIIVPVALSGAVLVFRGNASGDEPPLRVIQGSRTGMIRPQTVEVDPVHGEIVAADSSSRAILVYDRMANGNVAPLRKIGGPLTGALGRFRQLKVDSERGMVYLAVQSRRPKGATPQKQADLYTNEASIKKLRAMERRNKEAGSRAVRRDPFTTAGFIGAWSLDDDGNVPPRMIIRGPAIGTTGFAGVAFSRKHGEVYGVSGRLNGFVTWLVPEFFGAPNRRGAGGQ